MKQVITTIKAPSAIGPYSQGICIRDMIYVSGQLPLDPNTNVAPAGIEAQTRRALENVKSVLRATNASMEEVVEVTVFLQNMNDFKLMNTVYAEFFSEPFPTRAAVEVSRLPYDVLVEIKATAVRASK